MGDRVQAATVLTIKSNTQMNHKVHSPELLSALNDLFKCAMFQYTKDKKMSKKVCVVILRGRVDERMDKSRAARATRNCSEKES
jgi:hypothetical protein